MIISELAPIVVCVLLPKFIMTEPLTPVRIQSPWESSIPSFAGNSLNPPPIFTITSPRVLSNLTVAWPLAKTTAGVKETRLEIKSRKNKQIIDFFNGGSSSTR